MKDILPYTYENGYSRSVKILLNANAELAAKTITGYTALHLAALHGSSEVLTDLLQAGLVTELREIEHDVTALHCEALRGHVEAIKTLITAGADIHAKAERDGTVLHYAAQSGNTEAVQLLIDEGARFLPDRDGWTPRHTAASAREADTMKVFSAPPQTFMERVQMVLTPFIWQRKADMPCWSNCCWMLEAKLMHGLSANGLPSI